MLVRTVLPILLAAQVFTGAAMAQEAPTESTSQLAEQLTNPVASLSSIPFEFNHDSGYGSADGHRTVTNWQPVVPFQAGENWNVISRTIVPFIRQKDIAGNSGTQSGLGDIVQSLFFTPRQVEPGGLIWGVGPAFLLPTASDDALGTGKFGIGPTGVALRQKNGWTLGILANHIWSVAGDDDRPDVSATFMQPFINYTTKDAWTFALNTESTYDWKSEQWSAPVNLMAAKLVNFGDQPVSFRGGVRYWVDSPENGPEGWALRASITFLYPKK
ncbi:transporter [Paracoccus fistulariae]|uniref:Transporter n=1 Tax=Paracoccus fistulariae TaxID=658446 RepID=A0ABY7SMP8_9RHOB|nr:transporter [Paracoccus fistulariae]MDB6180192.1 transporter [Paracoccus fistulariae]WCR08278.1 transporter [Paracoccus fistulariae]